MPRSAGGDRAAAAGRTRRPHAAAGLHRIERGHLLADQWNRVVPEVQAMHEHSGHIPQEDVPILAHSFRSIGHWMVLAPVHSYNAWMATADLEPAYRYHLRILKLLQWNKFEQNLHKGSWNLK